MDDQGGNYEDPNCIGSFAKTYIYDVIEDAVAELEEARSPLTPKPGDRSGNRGPHDADEPSLHDAGVCSSQSSVSGAILREGAASHGRPQRSSCPEPLGHAMADLAVECSSPDDVTFKETLSPSLGAVNFQVRRRVKSETDRSPWTKPRAGRVIKQGPMSKSFEVNWIIQFVDERRSVWCTPWLIWHLACYVILMAWPCAGLHFMQWGRLFSMVHFVTSWSHWAFSIVPPPAVSTHLLVKASAARGIIDHVWEVSQYNIWLNPAVMSLTRSHWHHYWYINLCCSVWLLYCCVYVRYHCGCMSAIASILNFQPNSILVTVGIYQLPGTALAQVGLMISFFPEVMPLHPLNHVSH